MTPTNSAPVAYGYDNAKRLKVVSYNAVTESAYTYNALGQRSRVDLGNGAYSVYTYNHSQRWLTDLYNYNITGTMISYFNYTYDYAGNRLTMQQADWQAITPDTLTYEYDKLNQLEIEQRRNITGTLLYAMDWNYDEVGNRTQQDKFDGSITTTTTYSYNNANQLTSETTNYITTSYTYDGNGNMNGKSIYPNNWVYAYDYENHLVSYTDPVTSTNNSSYTYDALGRRTSKTVNSVTEQYFYDGANIIEDYDVTGTMVACYLTPFLDQNVLVSTGGSAYYYFQDGLGSVRNLLDSAQSAVNSYDYSAFGESYGTITETVSNRYKFTGREFNSESGDYYYRARHYTPATGRFGSRDPIEYEGGINLYSYVQNNPVNYTDSWGIAKKKIIAAFYTSDPNHPAASFSRTWDEVIRIQKNKQKGWKMVLFNTGDQLGEMVGNETKGKDTKGEDDCVEELEINAHASFNAYAQIADINALNVKKVAENLKNSVKWCKPCSIYLSGCHTGVDNDGNMPIMAEILAKETGCTVYGCRGYHSGTRAEGTTTAYKEDPRGINNPKYDPKGWIAKEKSVREKTAEDHKKIWGSALPDTTSDCKPPCLDSSK